MKISNSGPGFAAAPFGVGRHDGPQSRQNAVAAVSEILKHIQLRGVGHDRDTVGRGGLLLDELDGVVQSLWIARPRPWCSGRKTCTTGAAGRQLRGPGGACWACSASETEAKERRSRVSFISSKTRLSGAAVTGCPYISRVRRTGGFSSGDESRAIDRGTGE